jgi:hypothetical protein
MVTNVQHRPSFGIDIVATPRDQNAADGNPYCLKEA